MLTKILKKQVYQILSLFLLFIFNIDSTILLESVDNELPEKTQSWANWYYENKFKILIGFGVVSLIVIYYSFLGDSPPPDPKIFNKIKTYTPAPIPSLEHPTYSLLDKNLRLMEIDFNMVNYPIDCLLRGIKYSTTLEIYHKSIDILTDFFDHSVSKEETIKHLSFLLKYNMRVDLVFRPGDYTRFLKDLIEEIKKI